ncbi:MAG: IPT/TIG domain-containing protein, partial [Rhodospirillaceae bacterium]
MEEQTPKKPDPGSGQRQKRIAKPATPKRLERAALAYLERFSASRDGVARVLRRRVERSARLHGTDRAAAEGWITEILAKLVRQGWIDDQRFAEGRANALLRRGEPPKGVIRALVAKGVAQDLASHVVAQATEGSVDPERDAALAFCQRRRIGPFRTDPDKRAELRQKDLAALARRGFSAGTAFWVIDLEPEASPPVESTPVIYEVSPSIGGAGTEVTLTGSNFGDDASAARRACTPPPEAPATRGSTVGSPLRIDP